MAEKKNGQAENQGQPENTQAAQEGQGQQKKETLLIPLDPNGAGGSVFLCVNGRNMLVKRGETVQVPPEFAEVYRNAQKQQVAAVKAQQAAMSKN